MRITKSDILFTIAAAVFIIAMVYKSGNKYKVTGDGTSADPFTIDTAHRTIVYSSEDACRMAARRASKRIDSFIMLRCATTDSVKWNAYEDSVKAEIKLVINQLGNEENIRKYLNTHPYKKIPCMIGDSVFLFYKESAD